jgi:hypothetical protein
MNAAQLKLLQDVVNRQAPEQAHLIEEIQTANLTVDECEALRALVVSELLESGLRPDSEPTSYGIELEDLIDGLRHAVRPGSEGE